MNWRPNLNLNLRALAFQRLRKTLPMTEEEVELVATSVTAEAAKQGDLWHRALKQRYHDFSMCGSDVGRAAYERRKREIREEIHEG